MSSIMSFATSGLTASVGVRGQTAGWSISTTHATHVPHFPGVQHAIAAKQLIGDKQHIWKGVSLSVRLHLFSGMFSLAESSLPDMCLLNKQLWSRMEAGCLTHSESRPQTESHGSLWSLLHLTGTCICTVPPLVVTRRVHRKQIC